MTDNLSKAVRKLKKGDSLVLGDLIIDEFLYGFPERVSREAPVLILEEKKREYRPGGAANAAFNIASLGSRVELLAITGKDRPWKSLANNLAGRGVGLSGVKDIAGSSSNLKTRIVAGDEQLVQQQIVRIDRKPDKKIDAILREEIYHSFTEKLNGSRAILLSDYGYGLFNQELIQKIVEKANDVGIPIIVDSRYQLLSFQNITIATPNLEEAARAWGKDIQTQDDLIAAGQFILNHLKSEYLLITRGGEGMSLFNSQGKVIHIPVINKAEVYDVTGAGDTVAAVVTMGLAAGVKVEEAVRLANYAAGIVVKKAGVATVKLQELLKAISDEK
ncbi:MAG: bifunctional heptose 7-phosphate kinase/heptose 1-phosphate adenyltransferase [Bacillota bacterium]